MNPPRISIALPVYNGARTLASAIRSILGQDYPDWELLILDDASTDDSLAVARSFTDPRIRVVENPNNEGLAAKLNQGIDLSRGEFMARMDQDDLAYPERLGSQLAFLDANAEVDLLGGRAVVFDSSGTCRGLLPFVCTHAEICARPWSGFYLVHPTWMGRIAWFRRHRYRIPEVVRGEDQELLLRSYDQSTFACLPAVVLGYRLDSVSPRTALLSRRNLMPWLWRTHLARGRYRLAMQGAAGALAKMAIDGLALAVGGESWVRGRRTQPIDEAELAAWRAVWKRYAAEEET